MHAVLLYAYQVIIEKKLSSIQIEAARFKTGPSKDQFLGEYANRSRMSPAPASPRTTDKIPKSTINIVESLINNSFMRFGFYI